MNDAREGESKLKNILGNSGFTGGLAFLLVFWSALVGEGFNPTVFTLSLLALGICWARTWVLLPQYLRHKDAEQKMWNRFYDSDWKYVDLISGLTGNELDELRGLFERAENQKIRDYLAENAPVYSPSQVDEFIVYFHDTWPLYITTYIDDQGQIQRMD